MKPLQEGELIHLINRKGRHYPLLLKKGKTFQHSGETIPHDDLIGQEEGVWITLSRGTRLLLLRPTLSDFTLKMPRGAQIIYPKDIGTILVWADLSPGAVVLEAGIGSGALTLALLRAVGEKGQVISYEIREDFAQRALANIELFAGKVRNLSIRTKDIYEGIEEVGLDRIILDVPEPWRVLPAAAEALRAGGILLSFLPTILQTGQLVEALQHHGSFAGIETLETLLRPWHIEGRSIRPDHRMVAHTGFITVARKLKT